MVRVFHVCLTLVLFAGACASPVGPDRQDLASLLQTSSRDINALRCYEIPEEQTEFRCLYERRDVAGGWTSQEVMIALDGSNWVVIDGPGAPHRP
jgi:hypothetical protein